MAVTYTWSVANTEYDTATVVSPSSTGVATGVDGDHSASSYGTTSHEYDASDAGFIAYDSVTEANAIEWAKAQLDADAVEQAIADKIAAEQNPTSAAGVPWAAE
jgi:hypothetical protein